MASVAFDRVTKVYDGSVVALEDFSLEIADGEFMVLVGPSGCGKTTTLRLIAGLLKPDSGRIQLGERLLFDSAKRMLSATLMWG